MENRYFVAYGEHLNIVHTCLWCPGVRLVGGTTLKDYKLAFQGWWQEDGVANAVPCKGAELPVAVWQITPSNEAFLDLWEGANLGLHKKEHVSVEVDGVNYSGIMYTMHDAKFGIPSDNHLAGICAGYKDFNFPVDPLNEAVIEAHKQVRLATAAHA